MDVCVQSNGSFYIDIKQKKPVIQLFIKSWQHLREEMSIWILLFEMYSNNGEVLQVHET